MANSITTKRLLATNSSGTRVQATCGRLLVRLPWNYALNDLDNHKAAAQEMARRLEDSGGTWYVADGKTSNQRVFVRAAEAAFVIEEE